MQSRASVTVLRTSIHIERALFSKRKGGTEGPFEGGLYKGEGIFAFTKSDGTSTYVHPKQLQPIRAQISHTLANLHTNT